MKNSESSPDHWSVKWIFPSTLRHWAEDVLNVNVQLAPIVLLLTDLVMLFKNRRNVRSRSPMKLDQAEAERRTGANNSCRRTLPPRWRKDVGKEFQGLPENERTATTSPRGSKSGEPRESQDPAHLPADGERLSRCRTFTPGLKLKKFPNNWLLYEETKV